MSKYELGKDIQGIVSRLDDLEEKIGELLARTSPEASGNVDARIGGSFAEPPPLGTHGYWEFSGCTSAQLVIEVLEEAKVSVADTLPGPGEIDGERFISIANRNSEAVPVRSNGSLHIQDLGLVESSGNGIELPPNGVLWIEYPHVQGSTGTVRRLCQVIKAQFCDWQWTWSIGGLWVQDPKDRRRVDESIVLADWEVHFRAPGGSHHDASSSETISSHGTNIVHLEGLSVGRGPG